MVLWCTQRRWQGNGWKPEPFLKSSDMRATDVMGTYEGPLTLSLDGASYAAVSTVKYPTGTSKTISLSQLDQVFGEPNPAPIKYKECTSTKDNGN